MINLIAIKDSFTLDKIIDLSSGKTYGKNILINPCPLCGHKNHFYVHQDLKRWKSFGGRCESGGDIFNLYAALHNQSNAWAIIEISKMLKLPNNYTPIRVDPYKTAIEKLNDWFYKLLDRFKKNKTNPEVFDVIWCVEEALAAWMNTHHPDQKTQLEALIQIKKFMNYEIKRQRACL